MLRRFFTKFSFSQRLTLLLCLSMVSLASALLFVGEQTYESESILGDVIQVVAGAKDNQSDLLLKVIPKNSNEEVNVSIKSTFFCPVGSQVVLFKKDCKLFGNTEYEFISCDCVL